MHALDDFVYLAVDLGAFEHIRWELRAGTHNVVQDDVGFFTHVQVFQEGRRARGGRKAARVLFYVNASLLEDRKLPLMGYFCALYLTVAPSIGVEKVVVTL